MPEREPYTPELTDIHERGGLKKDQWERIISSFQGKWRTFALEFNRPPEQTLAKVAEHARTLISLDGEPFLTFADYFRTMIPRDYASASTVIKYAQKVISGEFPDSSFHHRRFLGSRHWETIKGATSSGDEWLYAEFEKFAVRSLNDYIERNLTAVTDRKIDPSGVYIKWSDSDQRWYQYRHEIIPVPEIDPFTRLSTRYSFRTPRYDFILEDPAPSQIVLDKWLLTPVNVTDPQHSSPVEMLAALRKETKSNQGLIQDRFREKFPNVITELWRLRDLYELSEHLRSITNNRLAGKRNLDEFWDFIAMPPERYDPDQRRTVYTSEKVFQLLQEVYKHHYGIKPFVSGREAFMGPWEYSAFAAEDLAQGRFSLSGEIKHSSELPEVEGVGLLEEEIT